MIELRDIGQWTGLSIDVVAAMPEAVLQKLREGIHYRDPWIVGNRGKDY